MAMECRVTALHDADGRCYALPSMATMLTTTWPRETVLIAAPVADWCIEGRGLRIPWEKFSIHTSAYPAVKSIGQRC